MPTQDDLDDAFGKIFATTPPPNPYTTNPDIPGSVVTAAFEIHKNYQFVHHLMLALGNCYLNQAKMVGPSTKSALLNAATEALYDTAAFLNDLIQEEKENMNAQSEQGG